MQPELNIGIIGHVDHGKTTLSSALSGKWTDTHSEELIRGITIRLGYADVNIYKCLKCKGADAYGVSKKCKNCGSEAVLIKKLSLVDAPGHESLMATMLCGANIMDAAILLVAANEECPQPQTKEHIMALEVIGIENIIVVQNKIDLVDEKKADKNYKQIKKFLSGTKYKDSPIIPISAQHKLNIDVLVMLLDTHFKTPKRNIKENPQMFVARSFDINKPGSKPDKLKGGVLGGALKQGVLKVGDEIEILPGYEVEERNQKIWKPLRTKIIGAMTGGNPVEQVVPGGSIAILTQLDPSIVKSDKLVGSVVGKPGKLPPVWQKLILKVNLLERVVGAKDDLVVGQLKPREVLMMNVNSAATVGVVATIDKNKMVCNLKRPVCAEKGSRVTLSRMLGRRWRLIGFGIIE